jgi:hypothetical protein
LIVTQYQPAGNMPTLWGRAFHRCDVLERRLAAAPPDNTDQAMLRAQLSGGVAVTHDLGADLEQLLAHGGQRPMVHRMGQGQRPEEVGDVVGQGMQRKSAKRY